VFSKTHEGGTQYPFSLDHHLEFFSKAGSLFKKRESFYGPEESALSLFQKMWVVDEELSMKLLFWLRDCRGGAGNRSGFRECINWLATYDPSLPFDFPNYKWVEANLHLIPEYGRWDDLKALFGTDLEEEAARFWVDAIKKKDILAAKWAKRHYKPLQKALNTNEAGLRRLLSRIRKQHIVEYKMCSNLWREIEYPKVPSVAMARYTNTFARHDEEGFRKFKEDLRKGKVEIKASVLFPHDCVRTVKNGDTEIADAQFDALPNYLEGNKERIIVISDTSGSMSIQVSGSVRAVDISIGMALYCSAKIPEDNPFHKKFIAFCSEGSFKNWNRMKFSEAVRNREIFDGAVGGTRIDKALDLILKTAKFFNLTNEQMPTCLLIISDMQFHEGLSQGGFWGEECFNPKEVQTEVNKALKRWDKAGYKRPKIIYWNTAGYAGSPETIRAENTALVSGFSASILKAIFSASEFTPYTIMLEAIKKYEINRP